MDAQDPARTRRRIVAAALVVVGVLVVGGIAGVSITRRSGTDNAKGDPVAAVRSSVPKVQGKRLRARLTIGTGGALQLMVEQSGVFDAKAGRADIRLTGLGSSSVRLIADGPTLYVHAEKLLKGKPWGRLAVGDAGALGAGPGAVSATQIDTLVGLLGSVTTAKDLGRESVDGARLRHYSATVPRAAVAAASPLFDRAGAQQDPALDVYLDPDGAPRQVTVSSETAGTKVQLTIRVLGIDVKDPITLPAPGDVATIMLDDLTSVLRG